MYKQWIVTLFIFALLLVACTPTGTISTPAAITPITESRPVTLTMGSWRTEDVEQMNYILAQFHAEYPSITIQYDPTPATEYDAVLEAQLAAGNGPDLFYLRSFAVSRHLYEQGYLAELDTLPGISQNFTDAMRVPWATDAGLPYGVPFIATSHAIYYNVNLFEQLGLAIPQTWEELLATAQTIQSAGYIPFANASGDSWTVSEIVFMNLAPNFLGGREGRLAYLNGDRCFNDAHVVAAFEAVSALVPFLPENQQVLKYSDSQQLFLQGKAAMWWGGSWDIPFFESSAPSFNRSVFAPPPPAGEPAYITFHLDAGMGLNAASPYPQEAGLFLEWMTNHQFATLLGNQLPGFFPMHTQAPTLNNPHANQFLALNQGRGTDIRFAWEKLRDGSPDGYTLMLQGANNVVNGTQTPQQAAQALQDGLAQWFAPAQTCKLR